jgi:predicted nucleic acid-binding protein
VWLTPFHVTEIAHAIEQNVFRGQISASEAKQLYRDFERDRRTGIWVAVDLPEGIFELSVQLAHAHVARMGTRTSDTLHVASALELKARHFWTFDDRQAKLARAAGLRVS